MTLDVELRLYEDADLESCRDLWREVTQRHREIIDMFMDLREGRAMQPGIEIHGREFTY